MLRLSGIPASCSAKDSLGFPAVLEDMAVGEAGFGSAHAQEGQVYYINEVLSCSEYCCYSCTHLLR